MCVVFTVAELLAYFYVSGAFSCGYVAACDTHSHGKIAQQHHNTQENALGDVEIRQ
jgi:hypothetical protein